MGNDRADHRPLKKNVPPPVDVGRSEFIYFCVRRAELRPPVKPRFCPGRRIHRIGPGHAFR